MSVNLDPQTVEAFGEEWTAFDQSALGEAELRRQFDAYFAIFPWTALAGDARGFDLGCGSGRWAKLVAPRVGYLHCIDASEAAIEVARRNLADQPNCEFHVASVDAMSLADGSMDFGYSLGVLHHVPDTLAGIRACTAKLKPRAPFLVYLYYALDQRPTWFRTIFRVADALRSVVSRLSHRQKTVVSTAIAVLVYYPLSRFARLVEHTGRGVDGLPLSTYRDRSFYSMRTDALDRFGTRLEQRFTREQVVTMLEQAGCENVVVSTGVPYWCAVGYRRDDAVR
jgi:SAM-dependent methyltransferase